MENDVDQIVGAILRADDQFLIEIGRFAQLFGQIEDCLVRDALYLLQFSSDKELKEGAVSTTIAQLRMSEKRDFLKRIVADMSRFYTVDHGRVSKVLDEFGDINQLRRTVVHGRIRWSVVDGKPIFIDSRGHVVPAWPDDLADLNLQVLNWLQRYNSELSALMRAVLRAYDNFADRLLRHPKLPSKYQPLLRGLKQQVAVYGVR